MSSSGISAEHLDRQAQACIARRDGAGASNAVKILRGRHAAYAPGWLTASVVALHLGDAHTALADITQCLTRAPTLPAAHIQRIRCLRAVGATQDAIAACGETVALVQDDPLLCAQLGQACATLDLHEEARLLFDRALDSLPSDPAILFNRAAVLRYLGLLADAERDLDAALAEAPGDWEAYGTRSQLRTQTQARNHVAELEALAARPSLPWNARVQIEHALAKEQEDLGDHTRSFIHLETGATLRRRHLSYDVGSDVAAIDHIIATMDASGLDRRQGDLSQAPIFILGLPRSGTTLVERILGSHPDTNPAGELNAFPAAVIACAQAASGRSIIRKHDLIALSARLDPRTLGAAYLARTERYAGEKRFIDKLPMNTLYAGLIAAALPSASLVHVTRHPMASGYAMYKTLFHQGYPFSYDLHDLARYIAAHHRLMAHWSSILGQRLITVAYEDLTQHQQSTTRSLLSACGLTWDPACLSPQDNATPSTTQSAAQIRQPVHARSVDQWRHYATQLQPLRRRLLAEGMSAEALA